MKVSFLQDTKSIRANFFGLGLGKAKDDDSEQKTLWMPVPKGYRLLAFVQSVFDANSIDLEVVELKEIRKIKQGQKSLIDFEIISKKR